MATVAQTVEREARAAKAEIPVPAMPYRWTGDSLVPMQPRRADQYLVIGEVYVLAPMEERSAVTHSHQFAFLRDAWKNLPEVYAEQFPTPEHLRKRLLIDTGWYDETIVDVGTNAGALRVAREWRHRDEFAYIVVRGGLIVIREAKSQARGKMQKADFQASKQSLLDAVSAMIGVEPAALTANAGAAA